MTPDRWFETLKPLCPDIDQEILRDFVTRMDPEYFDRLGLADIVKHVTLIARLSPDHPCQVAVTEAEAAENGLLDIVVVAYDYFSEFATICGLFSAFGLDIREGRIYTFSETAQPTPPYRSGHVRTRTRRPAGLARKKIVDLFRVRPLEPGGFLLTLQHQLIKELNAAVLLLDAQQFQEARSRVNRRLVETLGKNRMVFTGLMDPVEIRFDNTLSATHTVMDIRSKDTPAFLYAFANALTMRGLYIQKAEFTHVGAEVHDRFYVRGRHGHKIEEPAEQQELKLTAALIKQFTHFLTWAPDPGKAIEHFDQFLDRILQEAQKANGKRTLAFFREKKSFALLARLLGTSDFLWEDFLRRQHTNLLPMLERYQRVPLVRPRVSLTEELRRRLARARTDEQRKLALNQYKDQEMFRIDMKHLLDPGSALPDFSQALTELAEAVLDQAVRDCRAKLSRRHGVPRLANGASCGLAVFGLGKFGGRELGYASDIEVLFVHGGAGRTTGRIPLENSEYFERLVQELLQRIEARQEGIFHIDVRLRPHGAKSLLANSLEELQEYYSARGAAAPFERQALIKLRFITGNRVLGQCVEAHRDTFVYSGLPWDLGAALDLRRRQIQELVEPGLTNVKYSPGGLIDVEYAVQYLQLLHGHVHTHLRTPNTLEALAALGEVRVLKPDEVMGLRDAYLFLRLLIDGLRIVRGHAQDLVLPPTDSDAFVFLARRLGYTAEDWQEGAKKLAADVERHMARTREFFSRQFGNG